MWKPRHDCGEICWRTVGWRSQRRSQQRPGGEGCDAGGIPPRPARTRAHSAQTGGKGQGKFDERSVVIRTENAQDFHSTRMVQIREKFFSNEAADGNPYAVKGRKGAVSGRSGKSGAESARKWRRSEINEAQMTARVCRGGRIRRCRGIRRRGGGDRVRRGWQRLRCGCLPW